MAVLRCTSWTYRTLLIIILIVLIAITLLLSVIVYKIGEGQKDICQSSQCVHIASTALELMDLSADPCEDFFQFTCGNFIKTVNIPDEKSEISVTTRINDLLNDQLRIILEEPTNDDELRAFRLAKEMYQACMNVTLLEAIGMTEMKEMLRKFGGWPVLEGNNWREKDFDWKETVYKFRKEGFSTNYLIAFDIWPDKVNSSRRMINFDEPYVGLSREYLIEGLEHKLVKSYYNYMVDIAVIFGANKGRAKQELSELLTFQIQLANISHSEEERLNPLELYNPFTIEELQRKYPSIPWLDYINDILNPDASVKVDEVISVTSPEFLGDFEKLMRATPKRVQANYLLWRVVQGSVGYLTKELRNRRFEYVSESTGKVSENPRWKQCVSTTGYELYTALGALYIRNYFDEEAKANVETIFDNTKGVFQKLLENLDWMDDETRNSALQKLSSMIVHVGYPPELLEDKKIDKYYRNYEVNKTKFWKSVLNSNKFYKKKTFSKFRQPYNKTYWIYFSETAVVNAYYSFSQNSIELPAGILQGLFFDKNYPNYINYGGIGNVIGHEITHGFDNGGRLYDKDGNLNDWWANETSEAYNRKTQCIIDQYSNYTVPEIKMNINGLVTLGENIADIGGIKEAYYAYLDGIEENGEEPYLPGLTNYNGRQMFWIATGLTWCTKPRVQNLKQEVILNVHAPDKYRSVGSVSNMKEFAKDFNCKPNSKMNPAKKCQMW